MAKNQNAYWNGTKTAPKVNIDYGKSDNLVVNAFLAAQNIYYEMLNNGGWNFQADYEDEASSYFKEYIDDLRKAKIGQFLGNLDISEDYDSILGDLFTEDENGTYTYLDAFLEDVIARCDIENQDYTIITVWFKPYGGAISRNEKTGKEWSTITFGFEDMAKDWIDGRCRGLGDSVVD